MSVRRKEKSAGYDVIVVGGGMNGLCAAVASARHGAKTALIQDRPVLGGNASSEIRMHISGASADMKKANAEETGILREILLENRRVNDYYNFSVWDRVLFEYAATQENLTLYLNTTMYDAFGSSDRIESIRCFQMTTETEWNLTADIFCDCTGNGTLAYMMGAPFRTGSEGKAEFGEKHAPAQPDQDRMGNTLLFKAVNRGKKVEFVPPKNAYKFSEEQLKYRKHADLVGEDAKKAESIATPLLDQSDKAMRDLVCDSYCVDYGYWWIELTGETSDIIDEYETLRDELFKCIYGIWDHIKNDGDHGAANYDLEWVGMLPGMRESRRIEGKYILTENDLIDNRIFPDAVAYGGWPADNHVRHGLLDFDEMPSQIYSFDGLYSIPYRCYLPLGIKNLYISGRSMSASKLAMASSRVMGTCAVGGQAIGTAAAMCIRYHIDPEEITERINELQQTLLKDDCYIPGFRNKDPLDFARNASVSASSERYPASNVINGISRNEQDTVNCWQSLGIAKDGEKLTLHFSKAVPISQVRVTFDPDLNHCIKLTMSSERIKEQGTGIPPQIVRDYNVTLSNNDNPVTAKKIRNNYQRLNIIDFDQTVCDTIEICVLATHGDPDARIFEVRAY